MSGLPAGDERYAGLVPPPGAVDGTGRPVARGAAVAGYHFRAVGRVGGIVGQAPAPMLRRGTGRVLWGHLTPVGVAGWVMPRDGGQPYLETWSRSALRLPSAGRCGVWVGDHRIDGGVKIGYVSLLRHGPCWTDGALVVDEGAAGDAALADIGDDGGRLPLSIGFLADPGRSRRIVSGAGVEVLREGALLIELAIVARGTWPEAVTYARSGLADLAERYAAP